MSKKILAILLSVVMVCGCIPAFAAGETVEVGYAYPMQVAAKNDVLAIRLPYSDSHDVVQRIVNALRELNDPKRTSNFPVDFEKSFLVEKDADIWDETTTIYASKEGAGDEAPAFSINDSYMAANHGHDDGMRVTVANHGLSFSDIGSRWYGKGEGEEAGSGSTEKVEKETYWNLLRIVDENTLVFLSDNNGANRGVAYTFCSNMSGEYVREDDSEQKLNVTACSATQLQPSIRYKERKVYAAAKGLKLSIENGSLLDCDEVVIEECYDVIDPTTIADAIRENAPEDGYTSNPDFTLGGESMLEYNIKYTFRADGTMLQEVNHKVLKDMRIGHTPMVMHKMRETFTGGDIYRYLPNTIAFETETAINPGTTGTVTMGEKMAFDFSKRHKIASSSGETITYPYNYTYMKRSDCPDTEYPNERYIEYYTDADGNYSATYAEGLLPVGYASKENWKNSTPDVFYFYKSLKSYPYTYSAYKQEAGTTLNAVSYKKYAPVSDATGDTIDYSVAYGDTLYTYVDMFKTGESYTLPEGYTLFNKSANVEIEGNVATANFEANDTHAYVVVTSDYENPAASLTVAEVKAMLQAEALTPQPLNAVSSDIYLPTTSEDSPVSVVWNTTDPDIISTEGKITRDVVNEKSATLTATITDGTTTETVSHNITVLPQKYDVYKAATLYHPDDDKDAPTMSGSLFPNVSGATTLAEDENGNYYVSYDFSKDVLANGKTASVGAYTSDEKHQVVYLYTMMKPEGDSVNGIDVRMSVRNASNNGLVANGINLARIKNTTVTAGGKAAGTLSLTEFTPVIFKVDINSSSGAVKVGDGEWTNITSFSNLYTYPTDGSEHFVGEIAFARAAGSIAENKLMFSEGALYTEIPVEGEGSVTLAEAKKMVQAEVLTTQPLGALTRDIALPSTKADAPVSITWETSDPSVITKEGKITRDLVSEKTATITATIDNGVNTPIVVSHKITVLPQKYNVYKEQTFYFPNEDKAAPTLEGSFVSASKGKTLAEDSNGYYAAFDFGAEGLGSGATVSATTYSGTDKYQVVYLYAMIKTSGTNTSGIDVRTTIRNSSTNGNLGIAVNIARIKNNVVYSNAGGTAVGTLSETQFTPVVFKVDLKNSKGAIKVGNGEWTAINSFENMYTYPTDGTNHMLGALNFTRASGDIPENILMISEAAAYTEVDISEILSELTDKEKAQTFANLITMESISTQSASAITKDLTLDVSYCEFDLEALGVEISWKSDNISAITDSGVVTTSPVVKKATMTASVKVGEETVEKEFNLTVVPADTVSVEHEVLNQNFEAKQLGAVPASDYTQEGNTATLTAEYITDEDTSSKVLHMANSAEGKATYLTNSSIQNMNHINLFSNRYYVSYDVKYERADKTGEGEGAYGFVGIMGYTGALQASAQFHFADRMIGFDCYNEEKNTPDYVKYPMPDSVQEGEWFNVTIDYQPVSRSYQVYVNGELINDVPARFANVGRYTEGTTPVHVLRGVQFGCSQNGDLYVDNISALKCTNKDAIQANAAKNVGLMLYAGNLENAITDHSDLITTGPAENGTDIANGNICNLALTGASTISYKLDGVDVDSIDITEFGRKTLTVTGTYNGVTDTSAAVRTATAVVISEIAIIDNKPVLTLAGDFAGKTVFIATYKNGRLSGIDRAEAALTINSDLIVNEGESVCAFIMGAEANPQSIKANN